jgi:hypothetical protein
MSTEVNKNTVVAFYDQLLNTKTRRAHWMTYYVGCYLKLIRQNS